MIYLNLVTSVYAILDIHHQQFGHVFEIREKKIEF